MSNMNLTQAADEIRKILRGFKAVDMVADALEQAGSIENAVKESMKQLDELRKQCANEVLAIESAKAEVTSAKAEAKRIKDDAIVKANERLAKAETEVAKKAAESNIAIHGAQDSFNAIMAKVEESNGLIIVANTELESINKRIAAAKKQVAAILG